VNLPSDPEFDLPPSAPEAGFAGEDAAALSQVAETAGEETEGAIAPEEESEDDGARFWAPQPDKLLCALLFASQEFLGIRALKDILGDDWDASRIRQLVKAVNQRLRDQEHPFEVVEVDGTFRMRTLTKYYPWVRKLFKDSSPRRLSQASLETLAIIAYKQPITKAEIEAIRGVNVDGCMKSLLEKKLVDINGRSDSTGSAFTYSTTREFMRYFGISRVPDDLPRLSEFEDIVNAQALIPQVGSDGTLLEMNQPEPDAEQMTLGDPE
jgi:segregation and condensation protein B